MIIQGSMRYSPSGRKRKTNAWKKASKPKFVAQQKKNFKQVEVNGLRYDDTIFGKGMHTIKTKSLTKTKRDITKMLPQEIIQTYGKIKLI